MVLYASRALEDRIRKTRELAVQNRRHSPAVSRARSNLYTVSGSMPIATGSRGGERDLKLFFASTIGGGGKLASISASAGGGVDLGTVGRSLGLEPSSVRLNGHFVSRGPDFVSSLPWASLLSFFASRGLPVGASNLDPIVVQGKHAVANVGGDGLCLKREVILEDERPLKRSRIDKENLTSQGVRDGHFSDEDILCIKRKLKLDADSSSKKRKIGDCSSGCIDGHGKRVRKDDLVPVFPCKRVR